MRISEERAGLIEKVEARRMETTDPAQRARLGRLVRYLTQRLTARILTEAGRPMPARKGRR